MAARLSLAQQIAQLEEPTPIDYDPEDGNNAGVDPEDDMTIDAQAAREHYVDVGPSALRKLRDSIADPKYDGVRTSRKKMQEDKSAEEDEAEEVGSASGEGSAYSEDDDDENDVPSRSDDDHGQGRENSEGIEEVEQEEEIPPRRTVKFAESSPQKDLEPAVEDLTSTLRKTRDEDYKKGKAVSRQIAIWDTLLDARIRLQKSVAAANNLPTPENISQFIQNTQCQEALSKMHEEAASLAEEISGLQEHLMLANETVQPPPRKRRRTDDGDEVSAPDYDALLREATLTASALDHAYHPYLLQTLSKWSSKIQAVAPSVLLPSNRNAFSSKNSQNLKSAVQLVDETLLDHSKVLARTQVRRGKGTRLGVLESADQATGDVEVFDDTDFYQQILRDVIDSRGNGVAGGDDWMVIQKQKKAKKKVDTKASKGRKLRYEVHERIQNFMVPVPVAGQWHEEQIDELFASLLGKGFENAGPAPGMLPVDGDEQDGENELEVQTKEALRSGFRVFG